MGIRLKNFLGAFFPMLSRSLCFHNQIVTPSCHHPPTPALCEARRYPRAPRGSRPIPSHPLTFHTDAKFLPNAALPQIRRTATAFGAPFSAAPPDNVAPLRAQGSPQAAAAAPPGAGPELFVAPPTFVPAPRPPPRKEETPDGVRAAGRGEESLCSRGRSARGNATGLSVLLPPR